MVGLVGVGIGNAKGRDTQCLGEDVIGQAGSFGWNEEWLGTLGSGYSPAQRLSKGRVQRSFRGVHAAIADNADLGSVALDMGFDFRQDLFRGLSLDQADITLGYSFTRQNCFRAGTAIAT